MATMKGWGMEEEAQRMQGRLPAAGGGGGGGAGAAPAAPAAPAQQSIFRRAGEFARDQGVAAANRGLGVVERAAGALTAPFRAGLNAGREVRAGISGSQAPVKQSTAPRLARVQVGPDGLSLTPTGGPAPRQTAAPSSTPKPAAPTAPAAPSAPNPSQPAQAPAPAPSANAPLDLGTYVGDQGFKTEGLLQPNAEQKTMLQPPPFNANAAVAPAVAGQRSAARLVRNDATRILNPASQEAELLRRAENAAGSAFLKGRPGARNAIIGSLLGQIEAGNAASSQFQRGAGEALNQGASGAVAQGLNAENNQAASRLQRERNEGDMALEQVRQDAPGTLVGKDGIVRLRRGTTATPVTDEAGNPVQAPAAPAQGQLTPKDLLDAYTKEREAVAGSLMAPEEKAAALAAIDANPLFAPIVTQAQPAAEPPAAAIERLRANPEAAAQFDEVFGQGASARYLGN